MSGLGRARIFATELDPMSHIRFRLLLRGEPPLPCNDPVLFQAGASAIWQPISGRYFPRGCAQADPPLMCGASLTHKEPCAPVELGKKTQEPRAVSFPKVSDGILFPLHSTRPDLKPFSIWAADGTLYCGLSKTLKVQCIIFVVIYIGLKYCP